MYTVGAHIFVRYTDVKVHVPLASKLRGAASHGAFKLSPLVHRLVAFLVLPRASLQERLCKRHLGKISYLLQIPQMGH